MLGGRAGVNTDGENGFGSFSLQIGKNCDPDRPRIPQSFIDQQQRGHFTPRGAFPIFNVTDMTSFGAGVADQIRTGCACTRN